MNPELKELIAAFDAGVARICKIIDRAEARFASMEVAAAQPADPLADHPELPLAAEDEAETRWTPVLDQSPIGFPAGLLENLAPLPKPPARMRWSYQGQGDGSERENIYTYNLAFGWGESDEMDRLPGIHYAVAVAA
jgi:hypothetical protein